MSRMSKVAGLVAALGLIVVGALAAAPLELKSGLLEPPPGFSEGLWNALPELDQRAILGEPYPALAPRADPFSNGAPPEEATSSSRAPHAAPAGIDQGLWELLPDEDRRAILGEPYPVLFAMDAPMGLNAGRTLAPPPGRDDLRCLPVGPIPGAC